MRSVAVSRWILCWSALSGCYAFRDYDLTPDAPSVDVVSTLDAPDVPRPMDAVSEDARDAADARDASETPDVRDASDAADVVDIVDVSCPTGQHRCDGLCVDDNATATCGARCAPCPSPTKSASTCVMGVCGITCNAGFGDCDGDATNGCETDLRENTHCGSCMTACAEPTPLCSASGTTAACTSGCSGASPTRCGTSCVNTDANTAHCGRCDNACDAPTGGASTCASGVCGTTCPTAQHLCTDRCASDTDVATCGARCAPCAVAANAVATCAMGACGFACNTDFGNCDGNPANGCETDTRTSTAHCGVCGRACAAVPNATVACALSACVFTCNPNFADCDGNPANGCETDTRSNTAHCGMCNRSCALLPNAAAVCSMSTCGLTCNTNFANCDGMTANGCEVDTRTNAQNCGACGTVCMSGTCLSSVCEACSACVGACGSCPPRCGDGTCNGTETNATCAGDCAAVCGDGTCNGAETCLTCPAECGPTYPTQVLTFTGETGMRMRSVDIRLGEDNVPVSAFRRNPCRGGLVAITGGFRCEVDFAFLLACAPRSATSSLHVVPRDGAGNLILTSNTPGDPAAVCYPTAGATPCIGLTCNGNTYSGGFNPVFRFEERDVSGGDLYFWLIGASGDPIGC